MDEWRIAFVDLGMPGVYGYEVAKRLRAGRRLDQVKLVAVTGWGQTKDRRRTAAEGFDHHLVKPIDPDQLQAAMASIK